MPANPNGTLMRHGQLPERIRVVHVQFTSDGSGLIEIAEVDENDSTIAAVNAGGMARCEC